MTTVTGCSNKLENTSNRKAIQDEFTPFISLFPSNDLSILYDKDGNSKNLESNDLGTWVISSYVDTKENNSEKTEGIVLAFNRNVKKAHGFYIETIYKNGDTIEYKYPIYLEKNELNFINGTDDSTLINKLQNSKILLQHLDLSEEYVNQLSVKNSRENEQIKSIQYVLSEDDENIKALKLVYNNVTFPKDNIILSLESDGSLWDTTSGATLEILLDDKYENYITFSIRFSDSSYFDSILSGI